MADIDGMDAEQTIAEIERLERIFANLDTRPLRPSDLAAANRRHDEKLAHSPWFSALAASFSQTTTSLNFSG
jgi:hypothetical protein